MSLALQCGGAVSLSKPTVVLPVTCDNGRRGQAIIARQADLVTGTAIVQVSNGSRGQFIFVTFEQAFGAGRARTH